MPTSVDNYSNGLAGVSFDGGDSLSTAAFVKDLSAGLTIGMVFEHSANSDLFSWDDGSGNNRFRFGVYGSGAWAVQFRTAGSYVLNSLFDAGAFPTDTKTSLIITIGSDKRTINVYKNGVAVTSSPQVATGDIHELSTALNLGLSKLLGGLNGDMPEFYIIQGITTNISEQHTYLTRWL
jgi:hypothetical protein